VTKRVANIGLVLALMAWGVMITLLYAGMAHGQPTSAPATQPTVFIPVAASGAWTWFVANTTWIIPAALWLLANLCTVLSKYPKAKGVVSAIRMFMAGISMVEFKDGKKPGLAFKVPVTLPAPPPEPPKA
jgi:hypothetical protein